MAPCKSTAEEVSFEWSHHRILPTDSKVRATPRVFIVDTNSKRVKRLQMEGSLFKSDRFLIALFAIAGLFLLWAKYCILCVLERNMAKISSKVSVRIQLARLLFFGLKLIFIAKVFKAKVVYIWDSNFIL